MTPYYTIRTDYILVFIAAPSVTDGDDPRIPVLFLLEGPDVFFVVCVRGGVFDRLGIAFAAVKAVLAGPALASCSRFLMFSFRFRAMAEVSR